MVEEKTWSSGDYEVVSISTWHLYEYADLLLIAIVAEFSVAVSVKGWEGTSRRRHRHRLVLLAVASKGIKGDPYHVSSGSRTDLFLLTE